LCFEEIKDGIGNSKPIFTPVEEKLKLTSESGEKRMDATQFKILIEIKYEIYLTTGPNIIFGDGLLRRFMEKPVFFICNKRILRYIKGTLINRIFMLIIMVRRLLDLQIVIGQVIHVETIKKMLGYAFDLAS